MTPHRIASRRSSLLVAIGFLVFGCGSPPPAETPAAEDEAAPAPDPAAEPEPEAAEPAEPTEAEPAPEAAEDSDPDGRKSIRDVTYRSTPEGLRIEVEGVEFMPKAEPVKIKGGWGVKITLEATAGDEARHLLNPNNGPLAFAGKVKRKGKEESFGDKRDGEGNAELGPGQSQTFTSSWPTKAHGAQPLWWGNELTLDVGLWGLGRTTDARRPIKKFFTLKMVAGNKPQPVIQPPASVQ